MQTTDTTQPPLLAVLDYPGRRPEAAVRELRLDEAGWTVQDLLQGDLPRETAPKTYAAALLDRLEFGRPVAAVLAYCASAGLAQELADLLGDRQVEPPHLVVFDAGIGGWKPVEHAYTEALGQIRTSGPRAGTAVAAPGSLTEPSAVATAVEAMRDTLVRIVTPTMRYDEEDAAELVAVFTAHHLRWIEHLAASAGTTWPEWGGEVLQIASRDHVVLDAWPGAAATQARRFDCSRNDLLRRPEVQRAVTDWLRDRRAAAPDGPPPSNQSATDLSTHQPRAGL